jgi:hypothetical protein
VKRATPIFNNPINAIPSNRNPDAADSRFPSYPTAPPLPPYDITCKPGASASVVTCTAGSLSADFKSATATGAGNDYFPYLTSGALWSPCQEGTDSVVRCLVNTMKVEGNANMLVKTTVRPVEIFLVNNLTITLGSRLSGDDWSRFRIFGATTSGTCGSQTININPFTITTTTPTTVQPNLQNVFLWLSTGKLIYEKPATALTSIPALVGSVCLNDLIGSSNLSTLSNRAFIEGLGGAYGFEGVFGGAAPIRFMYRGFGFYEQGNST